MATQHFPQLHTGDPGRVSHPLTIAVFVRSFDSKSKPELAVGFTPDDSPDSLVHLHTLIAGTDRINPFTNFKILKA